MIAKKGTRIPMPDKSGMWKHGMSRIETVKSIFYICSYMKKSYQKEGDFPKGIRMFAIWVAKDAIEVIAHWMLRISSLPQWFSENVLSLADHIGEKWERVIGGGWLFAGKKYKSPFVFMGFTRL